MRVLGFRANHWIVLLAALTLPIVGACHMEHVVAPNPVPPTELTLRVGEHRYLAQHRVVVGFDQVAADSRCPTRVVCIWEGEARVELWLRPIGGSKVFVGLALPGSQSRSAATSGYRVSALALDPYPEAPGRIPQSTYRLTLRVESLQR